jgi:pyrrolidone-carboxylate peptidase
MHVLINGSEPFDGSQFNPSEAAARSWRIAPEYG